MTNPEHPIRTPDQLPSVSREALEVFETRPHDFRADFGALLRENPVLARALTVSIEAVESDRNDRLSFARGALWMYTILKEALDTQRVAELIGEIEFNDGDGDADQPLSA